MLLLHNMFIAWFIYYWLTFFCLSFLKHNYYHWVTFSCHCNSGLNKYDWRTWKRFAKHHRILFFPSSGHRDWGWPLSTCSRLPSCGSHSCCPTIFLVLFPFGHTGGPQQHANNMVKQHASKIRVDIICVTSMKTFSKPMCNLLSSQLFLWWM